MTDSGMIRKIVDAAGISQSETVLEIGAGKGNLTKELAKRAKKVIAIEIDSRLKRYLKMENVQVVVGNALGKIGGLRFDKIVSNIPYSVSEPLMNRLIFSSFRLAVLTVPKGFAYILLAEESDPKFSRLSMMAREFYEIKMLFDVPKEAFDPKPRTNSVVIKLIPRKGKTLKKLIFLQPRKLLKNALREALCDYKKMTKSEARKAIKSFNPNNLLDKKVMELTTEEWKTTVISLQRL
jgi:16S rRNA (adenine1518-N6/adenine1519-N6)-dimethyltransferase